ncbi:MAG: MBL fold metallo-hydrolase [Deltaproteobacteria bacterium]|nr:MBL fold metallo-hydrolase [Deltaproteobacteria bacterium]
MLPDRIEIVQRGDRNGNQWVIRAILPSGRRIFGLATENVYGGDWDLGPTWNYVVEADRPFLIDAGRYGMGGRVLEMMAQTAISPKDLKGILLSHGHEDHDGGLHEIAEKTGVPVWVHPIYQCLSRSYPDRAPEPFKKTFSASCWHCFMPESFTRAHCTEYHRDRMRIRTHAIQGLFLPFDPDVRVHHLPGHCPDAVAFQIGDEALIVGDTLLPEITPHPTQEAFFLWTRNILPAEYDRPEKIYGLRAYLSSLKRLLDLGRQLPEMLVLPAHRLFYDHEWRMIELEKRSTEICEHHLQRCASILSIVTQEGPRTVEEIVLAHFDPKLLKGFGIKMAEGEVKSHLELLEHSGDVEWNREDRVRATGTTRFERDIMDIMDVGPR